MRGAWASSFAAFTKPLPVVIWHGMGDSAYAEGLQHFRSTLEAMYPGLYVHLVAIEPSETGDRSATLWGNVHKQLDIVHHQLRAVPELAHGFDAVGFSQGGQFMRAYIQQYEEPRARHLITFGSQHMGITDLPPCEGGDVWCTALHGVLAGQVYTSWAQSRIVAAQYFRDTRTHSQFQLYLQRSQFLRDINNEVRVNEDYKRRLRRLRKFVMVRFDEDTTVVPVASAWFGAYADPTETLENSTTVVPLRESRIYKEDRLGLAALDRRGALHFHTCHGGHMQMDAACRVEALAPYIGQPRLAMSLPLIMLTALGLVMITGAPALRRRARRSIAL